MTIDEQLEADRLATSASPALPRTERADPPAYLNRHLTRRREQTAPPADEGGDSAGDNATPLYLRRFRERDHHSDPVTYDGDVVGSSRAWAEVTDHVTINDRRTLDSLSPYYIWTPDYAEKRLAWKRRHPLHILLLRVHRIPRPVTVRVRDEYHGCRSWVEIDRELPFEGTPVMADEEFDRARSEIRAVCDAAEPALV